MDTNNINDGLLSKLEKDVFSSLSFEEQEEVLEAFIEMLKEQKHSHSAASVFGVRNGDDGDSEIINVDIEEVIEECGIDRVKEMLREGINSDGLHYTKLDRNDLKDLLEKARNGTLTDEEKELIKFIANGKAVDKSADIKFTGYAILRTIVDFIERSENDEDFTFVRSPEPFVDALFTVILASLISKDNNAVGKMFHNHGIQKALTMDMERIPELCDIIIPYFQENNIAPERAVWILIQVLKVIVSSCHLDFKNVPTDKLFKLFETLFTATSFEEVPDEEVLNEILNGSKTEEESNKKSPNGDKTESKDSIDIRKLLLDD